jgi:hypothetical protein
MAAIFAALQMKYPQLCSKTHAASARSTKSIGPVWALGLSRSRGSGACCGRSTYRFDVVFVFRGSCLMIGTFSIVK